MPCEHRAPFRDSLLRSRRSAAAASSSYVATILASAFVVLCAQSPASALAAQIGWIGSDTLATGGGERGPWRQNESRYDYVDDPTIAIDGRGDLLVAWVDQRAKAVLLRRVGVDGAALPTVVVSRSPATFSWLPRLALAPDQPGRVHVLWQEIIFSGGSHGGDIIHAYSSDGGATFSVPVNLSRSIGGEGKGRITRDIWDNGSLDIVAAKDGRVYAAWTDYEGTLWFSRSSDGGAAFTAPRAIVADDLRPARAPSLAVGTGGAVHLAWTVGETASSDIRMATSYDAGASFGEPFRVGRANGHADAPKIAVDRNGMLHLVYSESSGGPFGQMAIIHARAVDGRFEPPQVISSPLPPHAGSAGYPSLAVDEAGRILVTWELFARRRDQPRGLGLASSSDGGASFGQPVLVPGSIAPDGGINGSHQGLLMRKLAVRDGVVAVVNSSLAPGQGSRVWMIRGRLEAAAR